MHTLTMEKQSLRRLDANVMREQLKYVASRALGGNRGRTWSLKRMHSPELKSNGDGYVYQAGLKFQRTGRKTTDDVIARQWEMITQIAADAGRSKGWIPVGKQKQNEGVVNEIVPVQPKTFAEVKVNTELGEHFSHLYERDSQIALVHSALTAYAESGFEDRFHCVLHGPPACGKTEILRSFARMLGEESVLVLDATSTTKAGAEKILLETAAIPPVLVVEEIEKTDEHSLRWLLGVLDHRAEIRKVTARTVAAKSVKLLCLATVNDIGLFRRVMDGALASRFSHHIQCPRPSRSVLERILAREIVRCGGNAEWIAPALDWCLNEEGTNDPRRAIAVCLCGRDKLLSGIYQAYLRSSMETK